MGAVILPGHELWIDSEGKGRGALVTTDGDWTYPCNLVGAGRIVLGAHAVNDDSDALEPMGTSEKSLGDILAEAPLTVHIEIGTVTLAAKDFARLLPGDVVETSLSIGEPVTLRIGGRAVATAELVNIEGQLGVRICELFTGESR